MSRLCTELDKEYYGGQKVTKKVHGVFWQKNDEFVSIKCLADCCGFEIQYRFELSKGKPVNLKLAFIKKATHTKIAHDFND